MQHSPLIRNLSLLAGFMVMVSTAPDVVENLAEPVFAHPAKVARDAVAAVGNLVWVMVGILTNQIAIKLFCSLAALMLSCLVAQQLWIQLGSPF